MLFTTHALTGAALGEAVHNPWLAFVLGLLSHHLLDFIPHFDPGSFFYGQKSPRHLTPQQFYMAVIDLSMGAGYLVLINLTISQSPALIWGALGGVLPDLVDNVPLVKDGFRRLWLGKRYHLFHEKFHTTLPWQRALVGLGGQLLIILASLWFIIGRNGKL